MNEEVSPLHYIQYPFGYNRMNVYVTEQFESWLAGLSDERLKGRILSRLRLIGLGSFGDCKPVSHGLHEVRIHISGGVRLYFYNSVDQSIVVVLAGRKATQRADIKRAMEILNSLKER
ncbi:MAG: type II toxin-antitoxin system RelE/ParE family toxin [Ignavibacteria bacterium]|nr:type II toxin-antitoxin system RelE/ParE family toxin [Ignavibacteria bacterium]MBK7186303.1 type II toxin-antitoxin system RelE/ParE family toxin [Ignavibacteria bacterium]MBK7411076.1 type II toxin-antitoxin system RelE/ParE family toxin [Ignavibacteria bacterium]MBK7578161.1 type II toxin-antitoxin system RelE/ParE family toxin [Ignavibacteria bacterium]